MTVNDYLAKRDSEWMGGIYRFLGLEVGLIQAQMSLEQRRPAYAADITYGTNNEFGFDYLRDNMAMRLEHTVQRGHHRDRGRGRLDPDRRGADAADHQRHGPGQRQVVPDVRADRAAAEAGRPLRGRGGQVPGRRHRGRRDPRRAAAEHRQPLRPRKHDARTPPTTPCARRSCTSATTSTWCRAAR